MELHILLLSTLFSSFVTGDNVPESNLLVQTTSGPVRGMIVSGFTNKKSRAFFGIPYAEPPIGKLRFKPPLPVSPWTEVFDATRTPLPCYQTYTKESLDLNRILKAEVRRPWSEDCLTLNIWSPEELPDEAPIMLNIHAGEYMTGTGAYPHYDLSTFSTEAQTVSISLNFRVGAFGFLTLGIPDAPGNLGLMDQHLAIRWVHDNAQAFGGKASAIFLSGFLSGAAAIGHHIILEQNEGLFKTGVLSSGSPFCSWTWQTKEKAVKLGKSVVRNLGCQNDNPDLELDCLQKAHPEDIAVASIFEQTNFPELFKPNVDGTFIKEPPIESMKAGRFNNVSVIAVSAGADLAVYFHLKNNDLFSEDEGLTTEGFVESLKRVGLVQTETELEIIRDWYLKNSSGMDGTDIRDQAVQVYSDAFTVCCENQFVDYATEGGLVTFRIIFRVPDPRMPPWKGSHCLASFPILVGHTLNPIMNYPPEIQQATMGAMMISRIYLRRKVREFVDLVPLYNLEDRPYLDWADTRQHLKNYRTTQCQLWNNILPKIRSKTQECN